MMFRTLSLCALLAIPSLSTASQLAPRSDVQHAVDARIDETIIPTLQYGFKANMLIGTGAAIIALLTSLTNEQPTATIAMIVCVYNAVQAMIKANAINNAEEIKRIVREHLSHIRSY